jgi:hypothetical protein
MEVSGVASWCGAELKFNGSAPKVGPPCGDLVAAQMAGQRIMMSSPDIAGNAGHDPFSN